MEGACGKILTTDNNKIVIKKVHRRNRAQQRTSSLRAEDQARMQMWSHNICKAAAFKFLFVPRAWDADKHTYKMERIDVSNPLLLSDAKDHPVLKELQKFFELAKGEGVFPADFELYVQTDGRVAMIDFDKFAKWHPDGSIVFPWGLETTDNAMRQEYPFLFS